MKCFKCGEEVPIGSMSCPKCGAIVFGGQINSGATVPQSSYRENQGAEKREGSKGAGLGIASMVLGIIAIVISCTGIIGTLFGIVGVILGSVAFSRGGPGKGQAIAGLVCGIIAVVISLVVAYISSMSAWDVMSWFL